MEFNKDNLQKLLVVAGLTPRDLARCMPCDPGTLYAYFKTGSSRPLTLLAFSKIFNFLSEAVERKILPTNDFKNSKSRQEAMKKAYTYYHFRNGLEGFEF